MELRHFEGKQVVGLTGIMSYANYQPQLLWQYFMPRRNEIKNYEGEALYSIQALSSDFFSPFIPTREFQKWAARPVTEVESIPEGMVSLYIEPGMYAVFVYKGDGSDAPAFFQNIFEHELPSRNLKLDDRLHFEILGNKYQRNDVNSEEEVWIPVVV